MRFPMVQPVTDMTRAALGSRLAPGVSEYLDMFHEDAVFEFPFGPGGAVRIDGKPAMAAYLGKIEGSTVFDRFDLDAVYPIRDDGMILEYRCVARAGETGASFEQNYVCVASTSAGRIGLYREYLNPLNIPGVAEKAPATALDQTPLPAGTTSLDEILRETLGERLNPADTFIDMFGRDGVLECPFAPAGALRHLQGKAAIADYYKRLAAIQGSEGMILTACYHMEDAGRAVLEYEGLVRNKRDCGGYRQRYLAVIRIESGRLTLFREYWNPLPVVASFGEGGPVPLLGKQ